MKKSWIPAAIIIALLNADAGGSDLNRDGDFQGWYTMAVSSSSESWKLKVEGESRGGDNWHKLYYNHLDVGISRSLCPWFEAGINYRQVEEIKSGEWVRENRPHVNGTFKWDLGSWAFTDRHRLEFRDFESGQDKWRYRNRLQAYLPFAFLENKVRPYLSDEIFVDFHGEGLYINRLFAGAEMKISKRLKADISYFWNTKYGDEEWADMHTVQMKCEWMF